MGDRRLAARLSRWWPIVAETLSKAAQAVGIWVLLFLIVAVARPPALRVPQLWLVVAVSVLANILQPPLQGLVLETYGVGNIPDRDPQLLSALHAAADRGVVIVNCTQCLAGSVDMGGYATGSGLQRAGAVSGRDMTAEAALAKLYYLLGLGLTCEEVKVQMQRDLRGELTVQV